MQLKKVELEREIKAFVEKNFPEALNEFKVQVKEQNIADINSAHIQNLINSIYYSFLQQRADSCTVLYILVRQFVRAFKDNQKLETLKKLWHGKDYPDSIAIPTLEAILIRDLSNPYFKLNHKYNYGGTITYTLSDLNQCMQMAKTKIMDIFNDTVLENELHYSFEFPIFEGKESAGVLPKL